MFSRFADELLLHYFLAIKPCYNTEAIKSLYSTKKDLAYIKHYQDEFLKSLTAILNERLQPGFAKVGKGLVVGSVPSLY
jgi:hypothetical protein